MRSKWWSWILIVIGGIASVTVYPDMPDRLPIHWGFSGEADRFADKGIALLLLPAVSAALTLFMGFSMKLESNKPNAEVNRPNVYIMRNLIVLALLLLHAYTIYYGYGNELTISKVMAAVLGLVFIATGNYMPRLRTNRFAGIRTPSTLANPEAWRKANSMGGKLFVAGGLLIIASAAIPAAFHPALLLILLVLTALSQLYAVWLANKHAKRA